MKENKCVAISDCPSDTYGAGPPDNKCLPCDGNCLECNGPDPNNCTKCNKYSPK